MLSLNSTLFPFRVMDCLSYLYKLYGLESLFKLQVFIYRFNGLAFLYLLECISVGNRLCFPGNMCVSWVLMGFCGLFACSGSSSGHGVPPHPPTHRVLHPQAHLHPTDEGLERLSRGECHRLAQPGRQQENRYFCSGQPSV